MSLEGGKKGRNSLDQGIVDDSFVLQGLDLELPLLSFRMNLVLLGADEGPLVDIGMNLNIGVVAEFQGVLNSYVSLPVNE